METPVMLIDYLKKESIFLDDDLARMTYYSDLSLCYLFWKNTPDYEQYLHIMEEFLKFQNLHSIKLYLTDIINREDINEEVLDLFRDYVIPTAAKNGLKKAAVVVGNSQYKVLYINASLRLANNYGLPLKTFLNYEDAQCWLLK